MADKRGFVRRNRGLSNSNTGPSHTNKKLQEIYFEAARHQRAMQKMWKRIGDNPTHDCSMWTTSTYRVCKETWWTSQNYPSETGKAAELIDDKSPYYKYGEWKFEAVLESQHITDKTIAFNRPDKTFMNKKTKNTFLIDIAVPNTHNLAKTITDKQNKYQEPANEICAMWKQKAAQVIPIVISYTEVIPKSLSQSLSRLNLHPNTCIQL